MLIIGSLGAAVGFTHTIGWSVRNGASGWIAISTGICVEGMAIYAALVLRAAVAAGARGRKLMFPVLVLTSAFLVQMWAQVSGAPATPEGWLVAALPAGCFLLVVKMALRPAAAAEAPRAERPAAEPPADPSTFAPVQATADRVPAAPSPVRQELPPVPETAPTPAPTPAWPGTTWPPQPQSAA